MSKFPNAAESFRLPTETDWATMDLDRAEGLLAAIVESTDQGRRAVASRLGTRVAKEFCIVCKLELPKRVERGREVYSPVYVQPERDLSGVFKRKSICSQACYAQAVSQGLLRNRTDPPASYAVPRLPTVRE